MGLCRNQQQPGRRRYTSRRCRFYEVYRNYAKKLNPVMRFNHKAGEKMFEDFSGDKAHYINPETGEVVEAELFVTALGASSYTFACAVSDQKIESFITITNHLSIPQLLRFDCHYMPL